MTTLSAGQKAPDFNLPRDTTKPEAGDHLSLADFAGHKVVLYFYPKDDTSGCTKEAIEFNGLLKDLLPLAPKLSVFQPTAWPAITSSKPNMTLISH